jgi:putative endopeptidase
MAIDTAAVTKIYDLEVAIAKQHMLKERMRRFADNYRRIEESQLSDLVTGVEWSGYLASFGLEDPGYLVSISSDYFNALGAIIDETSVEDWQRYLRWQLINAEASLLTKAMDQRRFEFYRKTLSGVEKQLPDWQRAVGVVGRALGELVGKVYVERHFPPEAKARMEALVANLIDAYRDSITQLDWMSETTKVEALDKLSKFKPMIGYPDEFRDYAGAVIKVDDYYGNRLGLVEAEHTRDIARHGARVDRTEWGMTPQTVNAYYSPVLNVIVFPAAILQPPFFNLEAEDAVNYGGIGAVIGHEIGHGLDDSGSKFDGDGAIRNWWTDEDAAQFEVRTNSLIAQYEDFCPFDDLCTNGEFTLGENIGDLGGITIALRAYQASLNGEEAPAIDGLTGVQRVFLGFAQIWRAKMRDEAMRQLIATNPHSPSQYRANGPVRNVPEWYEAFNVTPDNALYLPPEKRVKIW